MKSSRREGFTAGFLAGMLVPVILVLTIRAARWALHTNITQAAIQWWTQPRAIAPIDIVGVLPVALIVIMIYIVFASGVMPRNFGS